MTINYNTATAGTSHLILAYDAANVRSYPGSGTSVYDLSGTGKTGTLTNGPTVSNGSFNFDGVDDRIVIPSTSYVFLNSATIEMWFKINTLGRNQGYMGFNGGGFLNFWMPTDNTLRLECYVPNSPNGASFYSTYALTSGVWYHAVGTVGEGNMTLYLNGIYNKSVAHTYPPATYSPTGYIGDYGAGNYPSASSIAIAKVYSRLLTATEVWKNFIAHRSRFGV